MIVEDYDLEVEISNCRQDSEEIEETVRLKVDINSVLNYVNRALNLCQG